LKGRWELDRVMDSDNKVSKKGDREDLMME
jgi:hypothetical protein